VLRRRAIVPLFVVAVAVAAAMPARPSTASSGSLGARRTSHTITVNLTCGNDSDDWVSDSSLQVARGDTIDWVLTPESNVQGFRVKKKRIFGRWLFERADVDGAPGNPARGNDMKRDARGRYVYEINGRCQGPEKADIDPEIIVDD
jgi:hypothetical protein